MTHDPMDLRGQERQREEQEKKRKNERDTEKADFAWLMSDRRGRRVIWRLLERCGVFRSSFSPESHEMAFREGERNVGLRAMNDIAEFCPEAYSLMFEEQKKK